MTSTSQLTTYADLYTDLLNRVRSDTAQSTTATHAKRAINIALQDMHLGFDYHFPWAERSDRLLTRAQYSTGTVSISRGSQALTGTSTAWTTTDDFGIANARQNGKIRIAGSLTPYVVSSVGGATSITLSSKFTETSVAGVTYVYYEDECDLASDFLHPVDMQCFSREANIELIGRNEFRQRYPSNIITGRQPAVATIIDFMASGNTTPVRRVKFSPPPSLALTIPYSYITSLLAVSSAGVGQTGLSADTDEPIVPLRYRHAIVFHALYHWYRDKKDDSRSQEAKSEYTDIMLRASGDVEVGASRPQFRPRVSGYRRSAARPWGSWRSY